MSRLLVTALIVSFLCIGLALPAWADVTLSGSQTRGQGTSGTLRCGGVSLPSGGTIVSASDSGAGFWLQGAGGKVLKFNTAGNAAGTQLSPGTWYAYPNLPGNANTAGVNVTIRTSGGSGSNSGSNGDDVRSSGGDSRR